MFLLFLCAETAGLERGTQDQTAWDKLLSQSHLIQPLWWVEHILCTPRGTNFSLFFAFCIVNDEKSLNICEQKRRKERKWPVSPFMLLSNQIQQGFCCLIIEMFKCENRNDLHSERNVFTSTNENVPVALTIWFAHLSSPNKIEIVLWKCESPPFHQTKAIPFIADKQTEALERVSFVWKHSLSHAFERVAWCRNEGCLLPLLCYGPIAVRQCVFRRLMF